MRKYLKTNNVDKVDGQSFSGTDLNTSLTKPGIVFPLASGENIVSVSSIVDHHSGRVELKHTEARLATLVGDTMTYSKGKCIAIVRDNDSSIEPSEAEKILDIKPTYIEGKPYVVYNGFNDDSILDNNFIDNLTKLWNSIDFEPDTDCIFDENLDTKTYVYPAYRSIPGYGFYHTEHTLEPEDDYGELEAILDDLKDTPGLVNRVKFMSMTVAEIKDYLEALVKKHKLDKKLISGIKFMFVKDTLLETYKDILSELYTVEGIE